MEKSKRVLYYDLLNIVACIAVIALHQNGLVHTFTADWVWKECLLVEVGCFWAVPVFLMLSGATLMNYRDKYSTEIFFRKRLSRVVFPWLFWSLTFLTQKVLTGRMVLESYSPKAIFNIVLNCQVEDIYWFFPAIIGIYLFLPLLSFLAKPQYRKILWYIVGCEIILNGTMPLVCYFTGMQWNGNLSSPFNEYYTFFILGYLLSTTEFSKKQRYGIYLTGFLCACFRYAGVYYLCFRDGTKNSALFSYGQFHSFGLAIAVFVLFKSLPWERVFGEVWKRFISRIAGCSLGVYLIHRCVMGYEMQLFHLQGTSLWWRTGGVLATYLFCLIIVVMVKKMPVVKRVFP